MASLLNAAGFAVGRKRQPLDAAGRCRAMAGADMVLRCKGCQIYSVPAGGFQFVRQKRHAHLHCQGWGTGEVTPRRLGS
jgi:hypothetical protein